ncbi:MAG: HAMP domain-containing protein [candidate division KSB1 bacterium]|nr:HAMP domain-containing protein [candidate division KSB1 bacterium]
MRSKFIILIGFLVICMETALFLIFARNGRRELTEGLSRTCQVALQQTGRRIRDELPVYYKNIGNPNARSAPLGAIREAVLEVCSQKITGLLYARVIDRYGVVIAHNIPSNLNARLGENEQRYFSSLQTQSLRREGDILEYIYPLYAKKTSGDSLYLGVLSMGFSAAAITAPIDRMVLIMAYATGALALVSIGFVFFIVHRMTRQISELETGVLRIREGNLEAEIPVLSQDELGKLAVEFNLMLKHLRENLVLQKFVSPATLKMIRERTAKGKTLEAEMKQVTLLFSDIRNFSNLTERLTPGEIVKLINIYLDLQAQLIVKHGGAVDKYMGDEVMALFEGERQVDRAVLCAVEIQRKLRELNHERAAQGLITLQVGIGLNTGSAVMGHMGSQDRMDYTVIGDVVNLASRLCAIARPGQIIAPHSIMNALEEEFPVFELKPVWVKGRSRPVATFEILYDHVYIS